MTSIPVRKGTTVNRRSGVLKDIHVNAVTESRIHEDKTKDPGRKPPSSKDKEPHKPLTRQSSKKDLYDENTKLKDNVHMLEGRLKMVEADLQQTKGLLETESKNEKKLQDSIEVMVKKQEVLQSNLECCEQKLLKCNIDPVTLKSLDTELQDVENNMERCEQTKCQIESLRHKLGLYNSKTSDCIKILKEMDTELDHLNIDALTARACAEITSND